MIHHVADIDPGPRYQLCFGEIPGRELEVAILVRIDDEHLLVARQTAQNLVELLSLVTAQHEFVHDRDPVLLEFRGEGRTQRAAQLLSRETIVVAPRLRAVHRSAVSPQRAPDAPYASSPGAFLAPEFFSATANFRPRLRGSCSVTLGDHVMFYGLPDEGLVELGFEHLIGQFQFAHDFIRQVFYVYLDHRWFPGLLVPTRLSL